MDALLVMNPQNSFLHNQGTVYMGEKAETIKVRLIDYLSGFSKPKIFFREVHALDDTFFATDITYSVANTPDFFINESLNRYNDVCYDKTRYSAFYGTQLGAYLKQKNIKKVGLAGMETHTSILFTAEELRNRGYEVEVIEPCTAARDEYMHGYALSLMRHSLGVQITNG